MKPDCQCGKIFFCNYRSPLLLMLFIGALLGFGLGICYMAMAAKGML